MEFVFGQQYKSRLSDVLALAIETASSVDAAIAYVNDERTLIKACYSKRIPLRLYGRYDYSSPVAYKILNWFLTRNSGDYVCKLVADIFHPKIIWWHGFGVYVGSANLTDRAWFRNFEAGLVLTDDELDAQGLTGDLELYFEELDAHSHPLTNEIVEEAKLIDSSENPFWKAKAAAKAAFNKKPRAIPEQPALSSINKVSSRERLRNKFLKEWNSTIQILRGLAVKASERRPKWVKAEVPAGIVVDRFLHDYYYNHVRQGQSYPFREYHLENRKRVDAAVEEALTWWSELPSGSVGEIERLHEWPVVVMPLLKQDKIKTLTLEEFETLCGRINAIRDHALRASHDSYGLDAKLPQMNAEERIHQLATYLYAQRSRDGSSALDLLSYIIYGAAETDIPNRIFECGFHPKKIPHLGVSAYGEIVGCAKPDFSPPRNGRTSKALCALGYDVQIHSGG